MAETREERLRRRARRIRLRQQAVEERAENLVKLQEELAAAIAKREAEQANVQRVRDQITATTAALAEALNQLESAIATDEDPPPAG